MSGSRDNGYDGRHSAVVDLERDMLAYDTLPAALRRLVNCAPVAVGCESLHKLLAQLRRAGYGGAADQEAARLTRAALRREFPRWPG